jgi:phospholipase/lecithinase/hemolysin
VTFPFQRFASVAAVVFAAVLLPAAPAARQALDGIVVFGTSLSDTGNAFALTHETTTPPYDELDPFLVPSASYAVGGQHFTNGATWIEQLAQPWPCRSAPTCRASRSSTSTPLRRAPDSSPRPGYSG